MEYHINPEKIEMLDVKGLLPYICNPTVSEQECIERFCLIDDVLFGEVWARGEQLSARDRSIVTVTALMASGILDSSLQFHIQNAKNHGVTETEMVEILTHAAFYAGWPKAWAAFRMAKEIYKK